MSYRRIGLLMMIALAACEARDSQPRGAPMEDRVEPAASEATNAVVEPYARPDPGNWQDPEPKKKKGTR